MNSFCINTHRWTSDGNITRSSDYEATNCNDKDRDTTLTSEYQSERGSKRREHPRGLGTNRRCITAFPNTTITIDDSYLVSTDGVEVTKNCRVGPYPKSTIDWDKF